MERGRARDLGVVIGTYPPGPRNAVTDVGAFGWGTGRSFGILHPTGRAPAARA